jgi:uncharacterized protein YdeI (YjbR/CyaY-like superfamily)
MTPVFFNNQNEFRNWLEKNHQSETELWAGYYKVETRKPSMTWSQSVDQALCFGWIDGIRQSVDNESYCIRFTPRKKTSTWSKINMAKVEALIRQGLMMPAGLEAYNNRKENMTGIYSFENETRDLPDAYVMIFRKNEAAWKYYSAQPPSYRRTVTHWVLSAKQESTQMVRINKLIVASEKKVRLYENNQKKKSLSNIDRLIKLAEETFAMNNDPSQLQVDQAVRDRLISIHPATMSEFSNENGPVAWLLILPTTLDLMERFITREITEKELYELTSPNDKYEAIYLCSGLVLDEYRRKGIIKQLALKAIDDIRRDHPIRCLYNWAFTEEGDRVAERLAELTGLSLYKRPPLTIENRPSKIDYHSGISSPGE